MQLPKAATSTQGPDLSEGGGLPQGRPAFICNSIISDTAVLDTERWLLRLYVAGQTPRSLPAVVNIQKICAKHLPAPLRTVIGDLSDTERALIGLDLRTQ